MRTLFHSPGELVFWGIASACAFLVVRMVVEGVWWVVELWRQIT